MVLAVSIPARFWSGKKPTSWQDDCQFGEQPRKLEFSERHGSFSREDAIEARQRRGRCNWLAWLSFEGI
jgi:hypothetical protein